MSTDSVSCSFQDHRLPLEERVNDLVSRLTQEEKVLLLCQYQAEIPRLGIKPYKHGTEAAHGIAWLGEATTFPQPIGLACTWNKQLLRRIGSVIGDEARGFFRRNPALHGLTLWAPTVDLERDPRWGRTEEAYGEDPFLAGKLASALVQGMQGDHPFYLKAVATLKHFLGNNNEIDRAACSISIDPRNMREYYLRVFERPFKEGGALSMMTSYNAVNGIPTNLNPDIRRIVKDEWGMNGFIVSDAGDVLGTVRDHRYMSSDKEAVAASIRSGIDSITDDHAISQQAIRDALADGLLSENDLDTALRNTFRVRFRLGEFDPEELNPYAAIPESVICREEHAQVSVQAARENIVLLKNEQGALPLDASRLSKVAVIGPLADAVYRDWYSGSFPYAVTPLEGIRARLGEAAVGHASGSSVMKLKCARTGHYVRLSPEGRLVADTAKAEHAEAFVLTDWGWDSHTLQAKTTGKFVTTDDAHMYATADEIFGWFTKEVVHVYPADQDSIALTTWNRLPVCCSEDGSLAVLTANGQPELGPVGIAGAVSAADREELAAAARQGERFVMEIVSDGLALAADAAAEADSAIVVVGNHPLINGKETIDRPDITLAASQERLIREVHARNPNTIVIVVGSYPYALNPVNAEIPAILYTSHAGQELGRALADALFGDAPPAGRLNFTWYRSVDQLPDLMDYDIIRGERTYQYFTGEPLYPFGHGLTYSPFAYSSLRLSASRISADESLRVAVRVTNQGPYASDEVVQLYVRAGQSRVKRPLKQLAGFERVHIAAGETKEIAFKLPAAELAIWDVTRERFCVESGRYTLMVGRSSADIQLSESFDIVGETIPNRDLMRATKAFNYDDYSACILHEGENGLSCVAATQEEGAWLCYRSAAFGQPVQSIALRAASTCGGSLEIRLAAPDGALAGTCTIPGAEAGGTWQSLTGSVHIPAGVHDVYFKLHGEVRLTTFQFLS
ncbi:beta-glucosidase [Xylanibacillus composti]|uniref:Beta-glucosidase n=1 Tax=Xylanibacillus composti TaxID=1572762 RepID=A0A8J4H831_9BACL|nr:glycoside hydrolase family 3 protein [Xylanibacillus composti]MDT9726151.1 beta-glucosidase [Xylanibacillus composti]GIQ70613.1 beta-glucosidase [Xylanibacillus composti]